ncbi:NAD(P)/FAD-dependent oxidoreductase [Halomonas sp. V046]|uniref:NAD(P)/FAD-dependent oxidoreductase n=1 Tax=Halomonas sp. V046 TaxID=3459611 RepID=UPI004044387A
MSKPRIVVIGGGAGGLELVTRLGRRLGKKGKADVVLVDRNSTHIWKPLLHEVATGVLDSGLDEISYQGHSGSNGYRFQRGTLCNLNRETRCVTLAAIEDEDGNEVLPARSLEYDHLVLSVGSVSNDFGTEGVSDHCHFLDSPAQAEGFRKALLNTFLRYSGEASHDNPCITVGIIGAGATGVELSAELHDASRMLKSYGFTSLGREHLKVHVIEAAPKILPVLPDRISDAVHKELEKLGVNVHVDTRVTKVEANRIHTSDGDPIKIDLGVWAAGIKAPAFLAELGLEVERNNRVKVHPTMQSLDDPRIFAFGDCASCPQEDGSVVPPRAQAAHQQASVLYKNLCAVIDGKALKAFKFQDRGSLISLAHFDAVGSLMRAASARSLFIEGNLARLFYASLYRMHQRAIHGTLKTGMMVVVDGLNRFLKPRLKLH